MSNHYIGFDHGEVFGTRQPTVGTSTTSKEIELVILDGLTKDQVLQALERFEDYINTGANILGPNYLK